MSTVSDSTASGGAAFIDPATAVFRELQKEKEQKSAPIPAVSAPASEKKFIILNKSARAVTPQIPPATVSVTTILGGGGSSGGDAPTISDAAAAATTVIPIPSAFPSAVPSAVPSAAPAHRTAMTPSPLPISAILSSSAAAATSQHQQPHQHPFEVNSPSLAGSGGGVVSPSTTASDSITTARSDASPSASMRGRTKSDATPLLMATAMRSEVDATPATSSTSGTSPPLTSSSPTQFQSTHPAAFVRPPTPPSSNTKRQSNSTKSKRSSARASRSMTQLDLSPQQVARRTAGMNVQPLEDALGVTASNLKRISGVAGYSSTLTAMNDRERRRSSRKQQAADEAAAAAASASVQGSPVVARPKRVSPRETTTTIAVAAAAGISPTHRQQLLQQQEMLINGGVFSSLRPSPIGTSRAASRGPSPRGSGREQFLHSPSILIGGSLSSGGGGSARILNDEKQQQLTPPFTSTTTFLPIPSGPSSILNLPPSSATSSSSIPPSPSLNFSSDDILDDTKGGNEFSHALRQALAEAGGMSMMNRRGNNNIPFTQMIDMSAINAIQPHQQHPQQLSPTAGGTNVMNINQLTVLTSPTHYKNAQIPSPGGSIISTQQQYQQQLQQQETDSPRLSITDQSGDELPLSDREQRKAAIRQKNAMHMRIRNASIGAGLLTQRPGQAQISPGGIGGTGGGNRAAIVAALNAANVMLGGGEGGGGSISGISPPSPLPDGGLASRRYQAAVAAGDHHHRRTPSGSPIHHTSLFAKEQTPSAIQRSMTFASVKSPKGKTVEGEAGDGKGSEEANTATAAPGMTLNIPAGSAPTSAAPSPSHAHSHVHSNTAFIAPAPAPVVAAVPPSSSTTTTLQHPPSSLTLTSPGSISRTLSGILKSTPTPILTTTSTTRVPSPAPSPRGTKKHHQQGILRTTTAGGGGGGGGAEDANLIAASSDQVPTIVQKNTSFFTPPLIRTNTAGSRVGFRVPEGSLDSEMSSSTDSDESGDSCIGGDEHDGGGGGGGENDTADETGAGGGGGKVGMYSTKSKLAGQRSATSVGIPSLRMPHHNNPNLPEDMRTRKNIFVQNGNTLMLQSVSTTSTDIGKGGGNNQSHQAANVMVLSVSSIFTRLRLYTDLCFYLAMIGIFLTVLNKELYHSYPHSQRVQEVITGIRALTSLSTMLLIVCLYQYYKADFQFLQLNRVYLLRSAFWNTQLIWQFVLEVSICLIHEPPYVNHDIDMSVTDAATLQALRGLSGAEITPVIVRNPWSLLISLRFYFFLRLILSRYYTGGTKILGLWFNFNFNIPFAIRNMLYSHPLLSLAPVVGMLIFSCSYSLWVFEREAVDKQFSFGTGLWVVMITITAVGYGDITPTSSGGRAICVLAAFIGIMVTAVLVAAVHNKLTLLPYEGRMVEFLERDSNSIVLKYYASRCISRSWKYYSFRKKAIRMVSARKFNFIARTNLLRHKTVMLQGIFDFQTARKQIQAYDRRYHSEQLFRSMLEGLYDKLESMTLDFHVLEDELDLSYEETRRIGLKQVEILEEVKAGGGNGWMNQQQQNRIRITTSDDESEDADGTGNTNATPEHGRLALLRTTSMPASVHEAANLANLAPLQSAPVAAAAASGLTAASTDTPPQITRASSHASGFVSRNSVFEHSIHGRDSGRYHGRLMLPTHDRHASMSRNDSSGVELSVSEGGTAQRSRNKMMHPTTDSNASAAGGSTHLQHVTGTPQHSPVSATHTPPPLPLTHASSTGAGGTESRRGGVGHLNSSRAHASGGIDLSAAAAAVTANVNRRTGGPGVELSASSSGVGPHHRPSSSVDRSLTAALRADSIVGQMMPSPRGRHTAGASLALSGGLTDNMSLTSVVVETPRSAAATAGGVERGDYSLASFNAGHGHSNAAAAARLKRATLSKDVTTDLLSVVAALDPNNNPDLAPAPAGRIRFGESDFGAHRAAGVRSNRQTITIQRGKTLADRLSMGPEKGGLSGGANTTNALPTSTTAEKSSEGFRPSAQRRPSMIETIPGGAAAAAQQLNDERHGMVSPLPQDRSAVNHSPVGGSRPMAVIARSASAAIRAAHNARAVVAANTLTSEQFERMMGLLSNVNERLAGVEQQLGGGTVAVTRTNVTASPSAMPSPPSITPTNVVSIGTIASTTTTERSGSRSPRRIIQTIANPSTHTTGTTAPALTITTRSEATPHH